MKPELAQLAIARVPHVDAWEFNHTALSFGPGIDEPDRVLLAGDHVVELRSERAPGKLG